MTTTFTRERTLQEEIVPTVEDALPGVEVLAVELLAPSRLRVYIDHPQGVDHALCEHVTRQLDAYLRDFSIEVSSPGPTRPLRKPSHFAAVVGRRISVRTGAEIDGRSRFRGEVISAGDEDVTLADAGSEPLHIPYATIVRANLIDEG